MCVLNLFPFVSQALINLIKGARLSLDICVFNITDNEVANAIVHAKNNGIAVSGGVWVYLLWFFFFFFFPDLSCFFLYSISSNKKKKKGSPYQRRRRGQDERIGRPSNAR